MNRRWYLWLAGMVILSGVIAAVLIKRFFIPEDGLVEGRAATEDALHAPMASLSQNSRANPALQFVSESDPSIRAITTQLKLLEKDRVKFACEHEDEVAIIHEFLLNRPSREESARMMEIMREAKGLAKDHWKGSVSWHDKLASEYQLLKYETYIVSIKFNKADQKGAWTIYGVPDGTLKIRDNGSPFAPRTPIIKSGERFSYGSDWRFSYLVELE